jgi:hypothetical protein
MAEKNMKNPCWKGYEAYGMKKKNGKEVPNCVPVKEEIQHLTKQNIVSNILESKMKDGPGKTSQRPKSWDKGTKSGSEKRKMREQGKREARELNENWNWIAAAHHALQYVLSPADITTHFQNKNLSSVDEFRSEVQKLANDHSDRFISTQDREGGNPEAAMQAWSDKVMDRFDDRIARQQKAAEEAKNIKITPQRGGRSSGRGYWLQGPNGPDDRVWSHDDDPDAYDKRRDGYYEESVYNKLKNNLIENHNWVPPEENEFGAAADDMILAADDEEKRNQDVADTPLTHSQMVKHIGDAHEAALSRAFTAATMGKNKGKITPAEMRDAYHQHFDDVIRKLMDGK